MALPTPQEYAQKWAQRTSAAAQDFVQGAERTDKDPTALAIAALPRMRQQVIAAIDSGKVAAGLRRVGKAGWLDGIRSKGAANFASGVAAAQGKVEQQAGALLAYIAAGQSRLASMPANTDPERDARALFWINYMRQYQRPV